MKFNCPSCGTHLLAEAEAAGTVVRCPGCNNKIQVPLTFTEPEEAPAEPQPGGMPGSADETEGAPGDYAPRKQHKAWQEADPTNPNAYISFGIGLAVTLLWFAVIYFLQAPADTPVAEYSYSQILASIFFKHLSANFANTLLFAWAATICFLKWKILGHQREAMLLDVLPVELGKEINIGNISLFIDHVYLLPIHLRDSLMVNRIRKALEFFEVRPNVTDVSSVMNSQSAIDGARISASYIVVRAFLWAIPLVGFIGTVMGLSHAISGMSFSNVEDVSRIVGSINNVTKGLGSAFDATLVGLIFAVILNFPINALAKQEEETLNDIDAFCNDVLLPRLSAGGADRTKGDMGMVTDLVVKAITGAQQEFLTDLNQLSTKIFDYTNNLDNRVQDFQETVKQEFVCSMGEMRNGVTELSDRLMEATTNLEKRSGEYQQSVIKEFINNMEVSRAQLKKSVADPMEMTSRYVAGIEEGLRGLNKVLAELGEKKIVIQKPGLNWLFWRK